MNAEEERTYKHETYEWYKLHRICPRCRQYTASKGYICCPNCRDQALLTYYKNMQSADYRAERKRKANEKRLERIRNGLCTRCGKPVSPADTYICCEECRKKQREYYKRKRKREKEDTTPIRILWLENGRCFFCGAPVVEGKKVCRKHYEGYPERAAKALAARDLASHVWKKT